MHVNYDTQKINKILDDFFYATGINMDILKADFSFVGTHTHRQPKSYCRMISSKSEGEAACLKSDIRLLKKCSESRKPEMHICHAGLIDVAVPIIYNNAIIGYLIFGQIRTDTDFKTLEPYIEKLGLDKAELEAFYNETEFFSTRRIQSISTIAEILVKYILLENLLIPNFDEIMQKTVNYITNHLTEELSVHTISRSVNISKSSLYRRFRSSFGCTLNQYINKKRTEAAVSLLLNSSLSIDAISQKAGFSSCSYFNKIFKKEMGMSPFQYKKANSK